MSDFKLIYTSCLHIGLPDKYTCGEPGNNFIHFASLEPDAILAAGDITENGSLSETMEMAKYRTAFSHIPFWLLAGNHDAGSDELYTNYKTLLSPESHWVHDVGEAIRFIGFDSRLILTEPLLGFGKIESDELAWVIAAIGQSVTDGKKTVLCSHFPLLDYYGNNIKLGQAELLAAMETAGNVILYLSGHRHFWGNKTESAGTMHVSAPGLSYSLYDLDPPLSHLGGYFLVTVSASQIAFELFAADDPAYTARPDCNFSVTY